MIPTIYQEQLNQLNKKIEFTENYLDLLYEQRRELINFLNLNKGLNNEKESISKRDGIEPLSN